VYGITIMKTRPKHDKGCRTINELMIFFCREKLSAMRPTPSVENHISIYVPQWQGGPVIPPGTGFHFRRLPRLTGLRWRYSSPPPHKAQCYINCKNILIFYLLGYKAMKTGKVNRRFRRTCRLHLQG
jgi:hypothetical protein